MTLKTYLEQEHSAATVRIYLFEIEHLIRYLGADRAEQAAYKDVMDYLAHLRARYDNAGTIHRILQAIKQYYFYLIEQGKRATHPCRHMRIRDKARGDVQIQDLLTPIELEGLLQRQERYPCLALRNQVAMSLLVYQALLPGEIARLTVEDVDLEAATIHIHATAKTNQRTLALKPGQIMLLHHYLTQDRPRLLRKPTQTLILTQRGTPEKGEGIHYLCETLRHQVPTKRLSPLTIRQSVIANLLKEGRDLRVVQVFAGHKKPSATEKYRQNNLEALKQAVNKHHPLSGESFYHQKR